MLTFRNKLFSFMLSYLSLAHSPVWSTTLFGCPWLLIKYIHSYPPLSGSRLLHPQLENTPFSNLGSANLHTTNSLSQPLTMPVWRHIYISRECNILWRKSVVSRTLHRSLRKVGDHSFKP